MKIATTKAGRGHSAFTLIDVMVGMGVLGVVLVSLFASFTFGFGVVKLSREDVRAAQILHERMEIIRLCKWEQVIDPSFIPAKFKEPFGTESNFFNGSIVVTNVSFSEAYKTNLKQVIVTVNWTNSGSQCTRTISTLVSQYGLQRYIFDFK